MEEYGFTVGKKSKKLGFHYYKDAGHFDDPSLDYWLPKLQAAGTSWLVIYVPEDGEIPENFIIRLRGARIEPIVVLTFSISEPPSTDQFRQRMAYFRSIGIHMVQFFNRPNMKSSWSAEEWIKPNLVSRFVRKFAEYAAICVSEKVIPVFPMLEPGGDYWDLSFLRASAKLLKKDYSDGLLPNLVFSGSACLFRHEITWNEEGPSANPDPIPYASNGVDHRGFYLYTWYEEILRKELGKNVPMLMMNAGAWDASAGVFDVVTRESKQEYLNILNLIQEVTLKGGSRVPNYVLACCMYKLPATEVLSSRNTNRAGTNMNPVGKAAVGGKSAQSELRSLRDKLKDGFAKIGPAKLVSLIKAFGTNLATIVKYLVQIAKHGENPTEYFLLPNVSSLFTEEQLEILNQYVKLEKCASGNDLNEALASKTVIMLDDRALYPTYMLQQLQDRGVKIRTISMQPRGD